MRHTQIRSCLALAVLCISAIAGCSSPAPTYTKNKTAEAVIALCRKEYNLAPKVWNIGETIVVYLPLPRLLDKELQKEKNELQIDKKMVEDINRVLGGVCRVVLSMKPRPQFLQVVASDTKDYGIDYSIILCVQDIVKFQLNVISRGEFFKRNVTGFDYNPAALGDALGEHIIKKEIKEGDFIARQIKQRINSWIETDTLIKGFYKVQSINSLFANNSFLIQLTLTESLPLKHPIDTEKELLKIAARTITAYDFKDFIFVEVANSLTGEKRILTRKALAEIGG